MSALDSFNLGDFLRIREEDENRRRVDSLNSLAGLTLNDIILSEKRAQARIGRTLLDVIGAPEPSHDVTTRRRDRDRDRNSQMEKERRTWRAIKDRLGLRRNGAVLNSPDVGLHRQSNGSNRQPVTSTSGEPGPDDVSVGSQNSRTGLNRRSVTSTSGESGPADVGAGSRNNTIGSNRWSVTWTSGEPGPADVSAGSRNGSIGSNRRPVTSTPGDPGPADVIFGYQTDRTGSNRRPATPIPGESGSADGGVPVTRRGSAMRLGDHMLMDPAAAGRSQRLAAALSDEREAEAAPAAEGDGEQPVRMSLMELLEESTERQVGASRYEVGADEEEEEAGLEAPATAPAEQKCCVCMIRHRGAAFIPCGHTFCRACSRELFLQRGNCPLCNAQISEILDIF